MHPTWPARPGPGAPGGALRVELPLSIRREHPVVARHALLPELWSVVRGAAVDLANRSMKNRSFFGSPELEAFEVPPASPAAARIGFQTRVWTQASSDPSPRRSTRSGWRWCERSAANSIAIHRGRRPSPLARRCWPEEVSRAPTRRRDHIRWVQSAVVAIYTRGLHHSTAFKLPEYLAASRCVVAEPVRNSLPRPLVPGEHLLEFRSAEECVARCAAILGSRELQQQLRHAAWEYWQAEGRPEVRIATCLARVTGLGDRSPTLRRPAPP